MPPAIPQSFPTGRLRLTASADDAAHGLVQRFEIDVGRIEVARGSAVHLHVPLHQISVVGSLGPSECHDQILIAGDTTTVLQRCRAVAVDDAGTWRARRGVDNLIKDDDVLPVVTEVVYVVEAVTDGREHLIQTRLALTLRCRAEERSTEVRGTPVIPSAIGGAELMQVSSRPLEGLL